MDNKGFGMKWHNFLIYFSLWANAVGCFLYGFGGLSVAFGLSRPGRYRYNPQYVTLIGLIGFVLFLVGVYSIVTRYKLARRRENARVHLNAVWLLSGLFTTFFLMVDADASITGAIPSVVMTFVNNYYYKKRDELFIS